MRELQSTGETFQRNRPGYVAKYRALRFLHCEV
jgi:hypothetical protein